MKHCHTARPPCYNIFLSTIYLLHAYKNKNIFSLKLSHRKHNVTLNSSNSPMYVEFGRVTLWISLSGLGTTKTYTRQQISIHAIIKFVKTMLIYLRFLSWHAVATNFLVGSMAISYKVCLPTTWWLRTNWKSGFCKTKDQNWVVVTNWYFRMK